jgi:hypothetical protein
MKHKSSHVNGKGNGKGPEPSPQRVIDPEADYKAAVSEGKDIVKRMDADWKRLGELADRVEKRYGESRLEQFARDIGAVACTLGRRRSTYRAWADAPNEAPAPESYAVAQALQAHPDRFEIVKNRPNITKREAVKIMRAYNKDAAAPKGGRDWLRDHTRRWFNGLLDLSNKIVREAGGAVSGSIEPPLKQIWREVIDPELLPTLRDAGEILIQLHDLANRIHHEPDEAFDDAGDARLKQAFDLLRANKAAEAEAVFRTVAEEKAARNDAAVSRLMITDQRSSAVPAEAPL